MGSFVGVNNHNPLQYDMISHKRDSNMALMERNPLRSAILPTKVSLVMQQPPSTINV